MPSVSRLRRTLAVRRAHEVFGLGDYTDLEGSDAVMAFQRQRGRTRVVSLNNLTGWPQLATVDLPGLAGHLPVVLSGSVEEAPEVLSDQYQVELPPYGYLWLLFDDSPPDPSPVRS